MLSAWVPLGDVAVEAGPIVFVEGSPGFADLIAQHRGHDVDREPGYRGSLDDDAVTIAARHHARLLTTDFRAGDGAIASAYAWGFRWDGEAAALTGPAARETLRRQAVQLIAYRDL